MTQSAPTMAAPPASSSGRSKPKEADVFVGFMDEEVNDLLRQLRIQFPNRPVIVLERSKGNRLDLGSLFETPTTFYGEGELKTLKTTINGPVPDTYEGELARELGAALDGTTLADKLMHGKTKTANKAGQVDPTLLVGRFDSDKNVGDPVILLRCPEMGLQPELVQEYLTTILRKIKGSVQGDGAVRVHMFGAGGAIGRNVKPGTTSRIVGSLFLGAEFFKKSDRELAYRPAIKLVSMNSHVEFTHRGTAWKDYPFQLGDGEASKAARENAETAARTGFSEGAKDGRLVSASGKTLDEAARELIEASGTKDGTISLNVTFFGGAEEKLAGRQIGTNRALGKFSDFVGRLTRPLLGQEPTLGGIGLSDVNMEDYHVLVAARAADIKPEHIRLERVNADPNFISHAVEKKVRDAAHGMRLSQGDYMRALLWGFEGSDTSMAPDAASWGQDVFDPGKRKDRDMLVPAERVGKDKRPLMLNMFFGEIASDFMTALLDTTAGQGAFDVLRTRYAGQLELYPPAIKKDVLEEFDQRVSLINGAALAVAASAQAASPSLKQEVMELVELLGRIEFSSSSQVGQYFTKFVCNGSADPLVKGAGSSWFLPVLWDPASGERGRMKVWARPNKDQPGKVTVDELRLTPADVDRVLYKGSNRPALKLWAPKFVEQQIKLIAQGSLLSSEDPRRQRRLPGSVQQLELVAEHHARKVESLHRRPRGKPRKKRGGGGSGGSGTPVSNPLVLGSTGAPLPESARSTLEQHFKRDLSGVRVHTDTIASSAARSMGARAFTLGSHVYFAPGQYQPGSSEGMGLLGHEVAHVDQFYRGLTDPSKPHLKTTGPGGTADALERAADAHATRVGSVRAATPGRGPQLRAARSAEAFSSSHGARIQRKPLGTSGGGGGVVSGPVSVGLRAGTRGTSVLQLIVNHTGSAASSTSNANPSMELTLQRSASPVARALVRGMGADGGAAPDGFGALIGASGGAALPRSVQAQLGPMLGADFTQVRVHTGDNAAVAARSINAEAFTVGRDIYFGAGRYDPHSARGLALIGHELTHVAQGSGGAKTISPKTIQRKDGFFQSNKAYWEQVGVEGLSEGGGWGTTKAVVASLFAGFNDPFGEVRRDSEPFADALAGASGRYRGTLTFDDPQRRTVEEVTEFFGRTGSAAFNRAPAHGTYLGGETATGAIETWLAGAIAKGGTTLEELIYQAITFNGGNVTLAMGSIAEILCKGDNRRWASKIKGLHGNGKDYYVFAGAYVGLQPTLKERMLGWAGSHANIGGNPLVYSGGGAVQYAAAWSENDAKGMSSAKQLMTSRWGLEDNYNKFHEFNTGFLGATRLQRKGYEVAGHDALERQAIDNERALLHALSSGGVGAGRGPRTTGPTGPTAAPVRRRVGALATPPVRRAEHGVLRALPGYPGSLSRKLDPAGTELAEIVSEPSDPIITEAIQVLKDVGPHLGAAADMAIGFIPIVGDVYDVLCGLVGRAIFTWEKLDTLDRLLCFVGVLPIPFVSGWVLRKGKRAAAWALKKAGVNVAQAFAGVVPRAIALLKKMWASAKSALERYVVRPVLASFHDFGAKMKTKMTALRQGSSVDAVRTLEDGVGGLEAMIKKAGFKTNVEAFFEYKALRLQGFKANEAMDLIKRFRSGDAVEGFGFHFTNKAGGRGITESGTLHASQGYVGKGVYLGTTPTPSAFQRNVPVAGWGIGDADVRIPVTLEGKKAFEAVLPTKTLVVEVSEHMPLNGSIDAIRRNDPAFMKAYYRYRTLALAAAVGVAGVAGASMFYEMVQNLFFKRGGGLDRDGDEDEGTKAERFADRIGRSELETLKNPGPGLPLEMSLRNRLEGFLGADLSGVRIHQGQEAGQLVRAMGAEAFTLGNQIFVGEGWQPNSREGMGTLVHEATHVVQSEQGRVSGLGTPSRTRVLETEAYAHERAFLQGASSAAPARPVARPMAQAAPRPEPQLVVREAVAEDVPAPEAAPMPSRILKKTVAGGTDPIQRVMDTWSVGSELSREEFLETCTERVLELMREEMEGDAERGATNMAWSYDLPMS